MKRSNEGTHPSSPTELGEVEIARLSVQMPSIPSLMPKVRRTESVARAHPSFAWVLIAAGAPDRAGLAVSCRRSADTSRRSVDAIMEVHD